MRQPRQNVQYMNRKSRRHYKTTSKRLADSDSEEEDDTDLFDYDGNNIYFYCGVTRKSVLMLNQALNEINQVLATGEIKFGVAGMINMYIHSDGGDLFAGMSAFEHIRRNKYKVKTIVDGSVGSAATLIAMAGHERVMYNTSMVLIHQLRTEFWGKFEELQDEMKTSDKCMNMLKTLYLNHTKLTSKQPRAHQLKQT